MLKRKPILTDQAIKLLEIPTKGPRKVFEGLVPGLYLEVYPSGYKAWKLKYVNQAGKRTRLCLGVYPKELTLQAARVKAAGIRHNIANGKYPDPKVKGGLIQSETFGAVAEDWLRLGVAESWEDTSAIQYDKAFLSKYILPVIGDRPNQEINISALGECLGSIAGRGKRETVAKAFDLCDQILAFAIYKAVIASNITRPVKTTLSSPLVAHPATANERAEAESFMKAIKYCLANATASVDRQIKSVRQKEALAEK